MTFNFRFFTTISGIILVLILVIIGITVFSAYLGAQSYAKDQKRITDITQIQAALKVYFDENGFYPSTQNGEPKNLETYLSFWPTSPNANGSCSKDQNTYVYSQRTNSDYALTFCLGNKFGNYSAGVHTATSKGIQ